MTDETKNSDLVCVDGASSTQGCPTPSTTMSECIPIREEEEETLKIKDDLSDSKPNRIDEITPSLDNHVHHIEHLPIPGRGYMIRTREKPHRILTLKQGKLEFQEHLNPAWGVYWSCYEAGNFLYFRNTTSGTWLGYNKAGKIIATDGNEVKGTFVVIRQEGGGYILHAFHPETAQLLQVVVTEDKNGSFLREQDKGGTPLDFIAAKHVRYCVHFAFPNVEREALLWQE
ncbi:hypothetical protein HDV62DRAFT_368617 [Trichoderma sp. SZMC 28011]